MLRSQFLAHAGRQSTIWAKQVRTAVIAYGLEGDLGGLDASCDTAAERGAYAYAGVTFHRFQAISGTRSRNRPTVIIAREAPTAPSVACLHEAPLNLCRASPRWSGAVRD